MEIEGLINKICEIRLENNVLWMSILKFWFKHDPEDTKIILEEIIKNDADINQLSRDIVEKGK